jgi:phenylalanyl-tRNA synthetase beta chain
MRAPLSWLREFTPVEAGADELAARLTIAGPHVEEIIRTGSGIEHVVVGKVLDISEIPGATKIIHVKVDAGDGPREIVCGARNFAVGDLVPVAVPGAKLPNGMEIGRRQMHGKTSDGMLCSEAELGISDDHSGILVLEGDFKLGQDIRDALALDDEILDIDITPNRPVSRERSPHCTSCRSRSRRRRSGRRELPRASSRPWRSRMRADVRATSRA